jgi:hypothetical protein
MALWRRHFADRGVRTTGPRRKRRLRPRSGSPAADGVVESARRLACAAHSGTNESVRMTADGIREAVRLDVGPLHRSEGYGSSADRASSAAGFAS